MRLRVFRRSEARLRLFVEADGKGPCRKVSRNPALAFGISAADFSDSLRRGRDQRLLNEIAALVVKEPRPVLGIWGDNKSAFIEFTFA